MIGSVHKGVIENGGFYDFRLAEAPELTVNPVGEKYHYQDYQRPFGNAE